MEPTWIDKLGIFLFPNADPWDRHRKAWQVVFSVAGSILLILVVALFIIKLSGANFGGGNSSWKSSVDVSTE